MHFKGKLRLTRRDESLMEECKKAKAWQFTKNSSAERNPTCPNQIIKAGVNLKFAQKLSFLFSSEFAALGIQLRYGKIIFYLFSLFLPFWAISKFPLWLMVWLPWQREEHFLIFQLFMMCYSGNQAPKRAGFNERYFM